MSSRGDDIPQHLFDYLKVWRDEEEARFAESLNNTVFLLGGTVVSAIKGDTIVTDDLREMLSQAFHDAWEGPDENDHMTLSPDDCIDLVLSRIQKWLAGNPTRYRHLFDVLGLDVTPTNEVLYNGKVRPAFVVRVM